MHICPREKYEFSELGEAHQCVLTHQGLHFKENLTTGTVLSICNVTTIAFKIQLHR